MCCGIKAKENEQERKQYEKIPIPDGLPSHPGGSFMVVTETYLSTTSVLPIPN